MCMKRYILTILMAQNIKDDTKKRHYKITRNNPYIFHTITQDLLLSVRFGIKLKLNVSYETQRHPVRILAA